jgi:Sec-independent protein translocase protein TatA
MIKTIILGLILALLLFLNWNKLPEPVRDGATALYDFSKKLITENKEAPKPIKDKAKKLKEKWKEVNKIVEENY